ncbi:response regulator [Methyloceanibacter sp.]|uniref:response regulator n=1 Tax=Methyloceanibacter sp. TaxID=1965321 RepID=UPI002BAF8FF5|nr:response regulator [Methyloceanibacter sp.]HML93742.1 response regulator [Methyloceanibacter sp.]
MQGNEFRAEDLFGQIEGLVAQLEVERMARIEAEAANAGTLGLIDIVSKKLRPPMESVTALTDRILSGPLSLAQRRDAETLSHSMHRILSALTEVLDFRTLESGDAEFQVESFDFHAIVREMASALQACASAKGLTSSVDMAANCPRRIVGDAMRVRQVLMALMETAIAATNEGSIRLYVSVNDAATPVTVRFDITDTSPGLTPQQQAALFQPSTDTMRPDGGLGLPIAQRIAEAMGGVVACDSALGQGTLYWFTFKALIPEEKAEAGTPAPTAAGPAGDVPLAGETIDLFHEDAEPRCAPADTGPMEIAAVEMPAAPAPEDPTQEAPKEAPKEAFKGALKEPTQEPSKDPTKETPKPKPASALSDKLEGHVLLIEDNTVNRLLIGAYLEEFGLAFDVAETGAAALLCLDQRHYDLVLMDTVLPDYRGVQLAQRIRSLESQFAHVPIVALATLTETADEETFVEAGVNASVDKPIQGRELYAALVPLLPAQEIAAPDEAGIPAC